MDGKAKIAEDLFLQGYNCSQSVFSAFSEEIGLDLETALKIASSFDDGADRPNEICGAVWAMFMVAGLKFGYSGPKSIEAKSEHCRLIHELAKKFKEQNGSIVCKELLKLQEQKDSPASKEEPQGENQKDPCLELVKSATEIMEEHFEDECS